MSLYILNTIFNDAPQPWQIGFQDSAAPGFTGIVELHNTIFFYLVVICVGVFWVLGSIIFYYNSKKSPIVHKYLNHGTLIELIWTITPAFILIAIAFPSFRLLYLLDEVISPTITIKVVGHQWYWSSIHHEINLGLATEPVAGRVDKINQLELIERSFIMSSLIFSFKRNVHIPSISRVSSINHDKTYSVINKGLNHPSISLNVKTFLNQNKNLAYPYLFTIDDFNVPKGKNSYLFSNKYKPNSVEKKEIKNIAGVYLIRVLNTYDYYIGSATNLFIRFLQHPDKGRLNSKQKGSIKLYTMIRNLYPSSAKGEYLLKFYNILPIFYIKLKNYNLILY